MMKPELRTRFRVLPAVSPGLVSLAQSGLIAGCGTQEQISTTDVPPTTGAPARATPLTERASAPQEATPPQSINPTPAGGTPRPAETTTAQTGTASEPKEADKGAQGTAKPEEKTGGDQPKVIDKPAQPTPSDKEAAHKSDEKKE
jgi:hypothetical protein